MSYYENLTGTTCDCCFASGSMNPTDWYEFEMSDDEMENQHACNECFEAGEAEALIDLCVSYSQM